MHVLGVEGAAVNQPQDMLLEPTRAGPEAGLELAGPRGKGPGIDAEDILELMMGALRTAPLTEVPLRV